MSTDNVPTPRYSASEVLRNQKHFFQLDERLLLVFSPEQYMFINRLDFWIQQKLQTQLANGEPVRGWVEDEQRMYIFKTLKSSHNQLVPSWLEEFYHFSESTFTRVVKSLVQAKIVLKRDDKNKISKDKTLWYSLDYEALDRYYSEQFVKKWQAVIVTRITWELKKWLDFNPKVEDSTLTEYQRKKKAFNSDAKAQAKIRAEQLVLNYKDFNEAIINDEINEAVQKILNQLEQETFGNSLGCQNDSMSDSKGLKAEKSENAHEQSCCQNDGSDAVKMAAALTIYNQTNITNNNDTNRYGKTLTTQDYFIQGSNHSFLTPQTVVELSRIGENAKDYQDIIFRTKKKIEKKYELLLKVIPQSSKTPQVNGEFWAEELGNELIKYHFAIKEGERKGDPIKNPKGYFVSQMNRFWLAALDTEIRVSLIGNSLIQLKENSKSQPGHFLQERFSNQKFNEKELTSDLEFLQTSLINQSGTNSINIDIPMVGHGLEMKLFHVIFLSMIKLNYQETEQIIMTPEYFWTKITDFCEKKNMSMTKFCAVNQVSIPADSWGYCLRKKKFPPEKTIMNVKFLFSDDEIHELLCSNSYPVEVKPEDDVTGEIMLSLNLSSSYKADLRLRRKIQRLIYQGVL